MNKEDEHWNDERRKFVNRERARLAEMALDDYLEKDGDLRFAVANLLADIIHYAEEQGVPLDREALEGITRRAMMMYSSDGGL